MLSGLADAARYCDMPEAETAALRLGAYLLEQLRDREGFLIHSKAKGKEGPPGYLEDYAALIEGCICLYSSCGDPLWMHSARELTTTVLGHFASKKQPFFYFTSDRETGLIRQSIELADNVIPASNSVMAKNLFLLGLFWGEGSWIERAEKMLEYMKPSLARYSSQYANWLQLALWLHGPFYEIVVCGPEARETGRSLVSEYLPNTLVAFSDQERDLPLFKARYAADKTLIYLCSRGACQVPQQEEAAVLELLRQG